MKESAPESGYPMREDHPEDAALLDIDLPGFCPAVYPSRRTTRREDCLSRTSRLYHRPEP